MIVVFGSINVDLVARVQRLPRAGETLTGRSFAMLPGGKGANQALAASRAGGDVRLFGCVGRADGLAAIAMREISQSSIDVAGVVTCDASTGVALIHVDDDGENCITIVPGANASARAAQVSDAVFSRDTVVLMQLEVPIDEVALLARRARLRGACVVLNAAPVTRLPPSLLDDVDVLVVNESEAMEFSESTDVHGAVRNLASASRSVVVTCGAKGALHVHRGELRAQRAPPIDAVDTVGAGDAFAGVLAAGLDRGDDFATAVREGVAAGSLACLTPGAQSSLPDRQSIADMAATLLA
jgi:ribokinase